jgi:hypothetical protein
LFAFKQTVWILIMNDMPNSNPPRMGPLTRPTHAPVHLITAGPKEKVKVTYEANTKKGITHKQKKNYRALNKSHEKRYKL